MKTTRLRAILLAPTRPVTWRHWVYLVLGGAVMLPYVFLAMTPVGFTTDLQGAVVVAVVAIVFLATIAAVAATGTLSAVRKVEMFTARELLGGGIREIAVPDSPPREDRWRAGTYFTMHLLAGGVVGTLTITMIPLAIAWVLYPLTSWDGQMGTVDPTYAMPIYGIGLIVGFGYLCAALGALLARLAPRLLGPSQAARIAQMERVADDLAERNRLARDLHDSVGHSLSVVTLQAAAARRMWSKNPDFAYEALGAVEQSARTALADLDHVLGLLREETTEEASATLLQLDTLVRRNRAAGATIEVDVAGALDALPIGISREAYLMVQEALTNAMRHANGRPVGLRVSVGPHTLRLQARNPLPEGEAQSRPSGGRGVRGMRERVASLGGTIDVGADGDEWCVDIHIDWEAAK
ncbi:sensor histidine kinase [Solicola gregarius]|uniref:histidine kinase n=1 Tax=Solicola gregarius TaxID=2908642 RepID=A0AA46YM35_9ACTN|nr:histidine kinase [Solicola gregarius]UYM07620.1 histidine kinase [Solicola gregarius]